MNSIITPDFLLLSTLFLTTLNLLAPFISKSDSRSRNSLLIIISCFFFINILIIDWLFLKGVRVQLSVNVIGNFSLGFHLEPLSLIFLTLISTLWICALIYTIQYLKINIIGNSSHFLFFLNLSVLAGIMIALSSNLFTMFTFYEILTLSTAPLIGHSGGDKIISGMSKYLKILVIAGAILFLPAVMVIYTRVGHGNFISHGFLANYFSPAQAMILFFMFIFGIAKAALLPMHQWLPAAMVAHYPVSALLHAVIVVKSGLFCIYKILLYVFGLKYLHTIFSDLNIAIWIPAFTILYSSFKALQSNNIKKILAYSTINQLGIALLSAFMFTSKSMGAAILHLCSHSFTKICLFYAMGCIYSLKKTAQASDLLGVAAEMPKTSFIIVLASLSLIGIPPFGGFISKFYIMLAAVQQDQLLVITILALSTLFSALYLTKLISFIYKPVDDIVNSGEFGARSDGVTPIYNRQALSNNVTKFSSIDYNLPSLSREHSLPTPIFISLIICTSGVILFYFVQIFIKKFLIYIA
ncbi:proton-conducting transporter membrane subunit [Candidatus Tisiphia endosymbiont of Beris chalybata]|uniref:proton-conducting transporter transmembrane domain-containing protein n=1 Tax=Candidatus Tisiphia endosymbiont of Beris chalybata TaxID=3066262 RepID=UPI003977616F